MVKRYFPMGTDMLVASRDCFHMGRGNIHGQMAQYMMVNDHGKVTGAGNFRWTSGATYEGEVSGGYLHGCGTFNGTDGSIYRGAWRINVQHGLGRKQYCNLDIYEGSWKEGVKEGSGRYDWSSEDTYIGNWKAGNMCGRGVMKWASSDMYDGFWLDGLKHGSGFYRFSDGGYYFGTWSRGRKGGQGTFYPAGSKLPSLPNCYSSAGYYDDNSNTLSHSLSVKSDQTKVRRASINHSLPEKLSIGLFRSSGRISNRSVSLEKDWSFDDSAKEVPSRESSRTLSFNSEEGGSEARDVRAYLCLFVSLCGSSRHIWLNHPNAAGTLLERSHQCLCVKYFLPTLDLELEYGCTSQKMVPNLHRHTVLLVSTGSIIAQWFLELRIHHRYDLKGSSQGRITSKDEINENTTLKDLDLSYEFHMDKSWRESLFKIGEKVFPNGDRYAGSFKGLLPHGKGKYTWSDGTVYDGEWDHGKVTGAGNFRWTSGATYEGEVSGGYLHGCGTFNGTDGSIYRGAWRINVQHGLGRKQYCNLDIYEGSWKEGVKEGSGRYDWSTEDTYIGNWKAGNMCGRGVMKWANSDMYDGFWLDGLKHGSGFYRFSDGGYYFGTWSRDLKEDGQEHSILLGAKFHLYQTGIALLGTM
ncbi:hypothetical protein IFM89_009741 [Coptis chinensis]|uniref:PIPK domain-containing protein n=1 Tax=Coptis chinensis TaxID=261450 RepID=A0A835HWR4_9MAGN|nr:hypothetical protein IFM89_009741 [Coptis chinensis]